MALNRTFVAAFVAVALLTGGVFHATVPHSHGGHSHGTSDISVVWQELHASLRHEDKKAAYMLVEAAVLSVAALVPEYDGHISYTKRSDEASRRAPTASLQLRRGIERHRTFG